MFIYQSSREFNDLRGGEAIRPTFAQVDAHPHRGIGLEELLQLLTAAFGTQEPSWSALGWSAYRGAADYDAGALSGPEPQLLTQSRHDQKVG
jgi:hypothetical protein